MKKLMIPAVLGLCLLVTPAFASDLSSFAARVGRFTGYVYGPIRGLCICKEAAYLNRAGVLISSPGPSGSYTGIGVGCAVALFYSNGDIAPGGGVCNSNYIVLGK